LICFSLLPFISSTCLFISLCSNAYAISTVSPPAPAIKEATPKPHPIGPPIKHAIPKIPDPMPKEAE